MSLVTAPENHVWRALMRAKCDAEYGIKHHRAQLHRYEQQLEAVTAHAESHGWTLEVESKR